MTRRLTRKLFLLTILLGVFFWVEGYFGPVILPPPELHLSYVVTVTPGEDFRVDLQARGLSGRKPRFRMLNGWGVLQDQADHIEDVVAVDETGAIPVSRRTNSDETTWELGRRPKGVLSLRYRVRAYRSDRSPEASFTDTDKFVFLGYSMFLQPREAGSRSRVPVSVEVMAPENWPVWSSWPRGGERFHPATTHDLWSGIAAGGDFRSSRLELEAVSVTVLTEGRIQDLMGLTIANRLLPIMREMRDLFGAPPRGDSLQVLALYRVLPVQGKLSVMTGNSEEGSFLCLASPDRYNDAGPLTVLATHECLHFYLGGAIAASPEPPFRNSPDLVWLMEGITEYLTFKLMGKAGVLSSRDLDEVMARKEKEFLDSPGASKYSLADAARRMGNLEVYSLVYSRGYLVGSLLDREMAEHCGPGTFEAALRELFDEYSYYRTGDVVTPAKVREVFVSHCEIAGDIIDRYADGRDLPPLPSSERRFSVAAQ